MPWSNANDPNKSNEPRGPWGPAPGGQGGGNPNPWGQPPRGGQRPPDFDAALGNLQNRWRQMAPNGLNEGTVLLFVLFGALAWLVSGFYIIQTNQVGLNLRFGSYIGKTKEGLNYNWPYPIGSVIKLNVTDFQTIQIGADSRRGERPEESLMLTGDENIADVKFAVVWKIDPARPEAYAFNVSNPPATVKAVAESAMREAVGRSQIQRLLTDERKLVEQSVQDNLQQNLDSYQAGVKIVSVQLQQVQPPSAVAAAFADVTAAQQDRTRLRNEADGYAFKVVPEARGQAARIVQEAEAYREQAVAEAKGQTARFAQIYEQYKKAPDVTRQRLYFETMERVLGGADKIIVDKNVGERLTPFLPLNSDAGARR